MKTLINICCIFFYLSAFAGQGAKDEAFWNVDNALADIKKCTSTSLKEISDDLAVDLLKRHAASFFPNKESHEASYFFLIFTSKDGFSEINEILPLYRKENTLSASAYRDGAILSFFGELSEVKNEVKLDMQFKKIILNGFVENKEKEEIPVFFRRGISTSINLSATESSSVFLGGVSSESIAVENGEEVRVKEIQGYGIFVVYPEG